MRFRRQFTGEEVERTVGFLEKVGYEIRFMSVMERRDGEFELVRELIKNTAQHKTKS